jgi:hypothetical protein
METLSLEPAPRLPVKMINLPIVISKIAKENINYNWFGLLGTQTVVSSYFLPG